MGIADVVTLLGGIALFLFGMSLMGEGLKKVAGSRLELVLYKLSSTPLKGVLLGTGVTAVIQSSSATSVMVVGFVNSGMMKVRQAIGVIMGAIVGTSVTGWILCLSSLEGGSGVVQLLSTEVLTGVVAVIGIILQNAHRGRRALEDAGEYHAHQNAQNGVGKAGQDADERLALPQGRHRTGHGGHAVHQHGEAQQDLAHVPVGCLAVEHPQDNADHGHRRRRRQA